MNSLQELCLLDVEGIARADRNDVTVKYLRDIWQCASQNFDDLKLWIQPLHLLERKGKARNSRNNAPNVIALGRHATDNIPLFVSMNLHDVASQCLSKLSHPSWPAYIGDVVGGKSIIDYDSSEVLCWCLDPKRHKTRYTIVEYIDHSESLYHIIINTTDSTVACGALDAMLESLSFAWKRGVTYSDPHPLHAMVLKSHILNTPAFVWCGLEHLSFHEPDDTPTSVILRLVASLYETASHIRDDRVRRELYFYLDSKVLVWGLCTALCKLLRTTRTPNNFDDRACDLEDRNLRVWQRTLTFDEVLSGRDRVDIESRSMNTTLSSFRPLLLSPPPIDGFVYYALTLKPIHDINPDDYHTYHTFFNCTFTTTKQLIDEYTTSAEITAAGLTTAITSDVLNTILQLDEVVLSQQSFSLCADWLVIRTLIDALATRCVYRNSLVMDTISVNVESYVTEVRAKLVRVTGEWETIYLQLSRYLDYHTMTNLVYMWDTIRDTTKKTR